MAMQDPVLTIQDLLSNNWDNSNTSISYDPNIHTGWVDTEANNPQVTVSTPTETARGGPAPFTGIDPSGAGPIQEFTGFVQVDCWSNREWESTNPKKLTFEFSEEVKRIVKDNVLSATDLRYIGWSGRRFVVDPEMEKTLFRYTCEVDYLYREAP